MYLSYGDCRFGERQALWFLGAEGGPVLFSVLGLVCFFVCNDVHIYNSENTESEVIFFQTKGVCFQLMVCVLLRYHVCQVLCHIHMAHSSPAHSRPFGGNLPIQPAGDDPEI